MGINVAHHKESMQFEAIIDGKSASLRYKMTGHNKVLDYYSTFVPKELRGRHIGEEIVKFALDYAKENHFKIIPTCPFVARLIVQHPEYQSIVATAS